MDLVELIEQGRAGMVDPATGVRQMLTFSELEQRAGGTPRRARWHELSKGQLVGGLDAATVKGMARALSVSQRAVWLAAGEQIGLDVEVVGGDRLALLPPWLADLTAGEWAELRTVLGVLDPARRFGAPAVEPVASPRVRGGGTGHRKR